MTVACVVGTRPNFIKIAPILEAMKTYPKLQPCLVHTGQHYDFQMSAVFFEDLDIPPPDIHLNVGSGSHSLQTAKIMIEFEKTALEIQPDLVLVVGDVNSTLACSLVATKLHIPVAHVEAGVRSFDKSMPEEINRILTDAVSDYMFTPSEYGCVNLRQEGIPEEKIFLAGDVVIDTLLKYKDKASMIPILSELGLQERKYALITMHRPQNVDSKENLIKILDAIQEIQNEIQIVFPIHPRTRRRIDEFQLIEKLSDMGNLIVIEPMGYLRFSNLMMNARFVLTDSGGMQQETTMLNIPCLTMRNNTERPETIRYGTNKLVGNDTQRIIKESSTILHGPDKVRMYPELWDGHAANRIMETIDKFPTNNASGSTSSNLFERD